MFNKLNQGISVILEIERHVFSRKGIFRIPVAFPDKNNDRIGIGQPERFPTVSNPEYAFAENGSGFFIDENHIFYEFDIRERRLIYLSLIHI